MIAKKKDGKFGEIAVLLTEDEKIEKWRRLFAASYLIINIGFQGNSFM